MNKRIKFIFFLMACLMPLAMVAQQTHWTPQGSAYEDNMTLTGVIQINGVEQQSAALEVGAFCGTECRGAVRAVLFPATQRYVVMLTIFGNNGDQITFKLYDHNQGMELNYQSPAAVTFGSNGLGTLMNPYVLNFTSLEYTISASASPSNGGTISGAGTYPSGSTCTLTATPATGYSFVRWTKNGSQVSTNPSYSFTVTGNASYVAVFSLNSYSISVSANPSAGGTVSGGGTYNYGSSCTLTATPATGYSFVRWTKNGSQVSTNPSYSFTVTGNASYVAVFSLNSYTISVSANPSAGGTVSGGGTYNYGSSCTLTATPAAGYSFVRWTKNGSQVSTNPSYSFTVTGNASYVAVFSLNSYTISASSSPSAGGSVSGAGSYNYGSTCTLTATANTGYTFVRWTKNGTQVSTNPSYSFTVTGNASYVAVFSLNSYTISVSANPSEGGTVSGGGTYNYGSSCTLTATPATGYSFVRWTKNGSQVSTNPSYSFTVTGNASYVAVFSLNSYTISVSANPSEGGTVSGGGTYNYGSSCTLTATPATGYSFVRWTKNGTQVSTNASYSFTVTEAASYVAVFEAENIIVFADPNVKAICVANWDTNGSGELSYAEAAAVTSLGQVFRGDTTITSFEELQFFTGLTAFGSYAFEDCSNLSGTLYIPNSVTSIGDYAFSFCSGLTGNLNIPSSVTSIGKGAFFFCSGLTGNLTIPNSVTSIGEVAFYYCSGFTGDLAISSTVTTIEPSTFYYCNGFTGDLTIPNSVTTIGEGAFSNCSGFNGDLVIPNSVATIGQFAFFHCNGFTGSLTIPNSVTTIGRDAFSDCSGFTGSLTIPNSVEFIDISTFYDCSGFTGTLTIGNSVTAIGNWAFSGCSGFTSMNVLSEIPPTLGNYVFDIVNKSIPVYVPCSSVSSYQAAEGWSEFTNYQCIIHEYVDLGLPSGTLWATYNVGAYSPEEYGDYFAWGETQTKDNYDWSTYQYCMGSENTLTKYCNDAWYGYNGFTDNLTTLQSSDDAATVSWGMDWRMPTEEEWQELYNNTTSIWMTQNGVNGRLFTASNGNSIFLPAAGCHDGISFNNTFSNGYYWSNSLDTNQPNIAWSFNIRSGNNFGVNNFGRFYGQSVRAVRNIFHVTVSSNPAEGGSIEGAGTYDNGSTCTLTAEANEGYSFMYWTENGNQVSTNATYSFTVTSDRSLVAHFTLPLNITVATNPTEGGVATGDGDYAYSTTCTLTAEANQGYSFVKWTKNGNDVSYVSPYSFTVTEEANYVAHFEELSGVVVGVPESTNVYLPSYSLYNYTLSQQIYTPEEIGGSTIITNLSFFNVGAQKTRNYDIYLVHTDKNTFDSNTDWIAVSEADCVFSGDVNMLSGHWNTIVLDTPFAYNGNSNLAIIVDDNSGNWSSNNMNCRVFNANGNQAIRVFGDYTNYDPLYPSNYGGTLHSVKNQIILNNYVYNVIVSTNITDAGSVNGSGSFGFGQICTLTATPNEGYLFLNWSRNGEVVSFDSNYSFTVTENIDLKAIFMPLHGRLVGAGEATNQYLPSYSYYCYTLSQQIYTPDEIGAAGSILTISYFNAGETKTRSYDIYMVHTDKNTFENNTDWITVTEADRVFSGEVTMTRGYWNTVLLDTPFDYDGTSNLAIVVDDNSGDYTGSPHMQCRVFNANGNQAIRVYSDGTNYDPYNPSGYGGTLHSVKNQMIFGVMPAYHFVTAGTWGNAANWSGGALPGADDAVFIDANCALNRDAEVALLSVTPGQVLTLRPGKTLSVTGNLFNTAIEGLVVEDGAQLVSTSFNVAATVKKNVQAYNNSNPDGWYTISSPMNGMVIEGSNFLTSGYDLYRFNETNLTHDEWENYKVNLADFTTFEKGRGYLYANSNTFAPAFTGILNNLDVTYTLTCTERPNDPLSGFNLIGNPFPHEIYKGAGGAINNVNLASGYYTLTNEGTWEVHSFDDAIQPGQGFLVKATAPTVLTIAKSNEMAFSESGDAKKGVTERMCISVAGDNGQDRTYVYFGQGVGLDKKNDFDAQVPNLWIRDNGHDYAIAHVEDTEESLELCFSNRQEGDFTLAITTSDMEFEYLQLIDRAAGVTVDLLKQSVYTFHSERNEGTKRFTLAFKKK